MTVLYLVRHGETIDNVNHVMQGQTQGELNETGISQAQRVGRELSNIHFDAYISSDLKRCMDTCRIIMGNKTLMIHDTKLLRERDWGSFTGRLISDLKDLNDPEKWPKDIEPLDVLKQRASDFLSWVKNNFPNQVVLAVGHGIINKAVQSVFYNKPMSEIVVMHNADVRILKL